MIHFLKIQNNTIIEAPKQINKNGYKIYGYNNPNNQFMLLNDGYMPYPKQLQCYEIIDGEIKEKSNPILRNVFNKLEIRRALRNAGLEYKLDDLLTNNETFRKDWNDAVEIDLQEQTIKNAIQSNVITQDMINAIRGI